MKRSRLEMEMNDICAEFDGTPCERARAAARPCRSQRRAVGQWGVRTLLLLPGRHASLLARLEQHSCDVAARAYVRRDANSAVALVREGCVCGAPCQGAE
jgi:hypothetical protein